MSKGIESKIRSDFEHRFASKMVLKGGRSVAVETEAIGGKSGIARGGRGLAIADGVADEAGTARVFDTVKKQNPHGERSLGRNAAFFAQSRSAKPSCEEKQASRAFQRGKILTVPRARQKAVRAKIEKILENHGLGKIATIEEAMLASLGVKATFERFRAAACKAAISLNLCSASAYPRGFAVCDEIHTACGWKICIDGQRAAIVKKALLREKGAKAR